MQWLECQLWNEARTWPGAFLLANCGPWADEQTSHIFHSLPTKWRPYFHHTVCHSKAYTIYWFSIIAQEVFVFFFFLSWIGSKGRNQHREQKRRKLESSLYFLPAHPWSLSPTQLLPEPLTKTALANHQGPTFQLLKPVNSFFSTSFDTVDFSFVRNSSLGFFSTLRYHLLPNAHPHQEGHFLPSSNHLLTALSSVTPFPHFSQTGVLMYKPIMLLQSLYMNLHIPAPGGPWLYVFRSPTALLTYPNSFGLSCLYTRLPWWLRQ